MNYHESCKEVTKQRAGFGDKSILIIREERDAARSYYFIQKCIKKLY